MELKKPLRSPIALKPLILLDFRHKKRRPWTSLVDQMVGRGNLNPISKIMIYMVNICFYFWLEYHLEYHLEYRAKIVLHLTTRFGEGKA